MKILMKILIAGLGLLLLGGGLYCLTLGILLLLSTNLWIEDKNLVAVMMLLLGKLALINFYFLKKCHKYCQH